MNILVTGANGYLGRGICRALLNEGHRVIAADVRKRNLPEGVIYAPGDLFTVGNPYLYYRSPDVCLYLAGQDGFRHSARSHIENLPKHWQCIQNLIEDGLQQIAVMGSVHEVGPVAGQVAPDTPMAPVHPYGIAKETLYRLTAWQAKEADRIFQWLRAYYVVPVQGDEKNAYEEALARIREERLEPCSAEPDVLTGSWKENNTKSPVDSDQTMRESFSDELDGKVTTAADRASETDGRIPETGQQRCTARVRRRLAPVPERSVRIRNATLRCMLDLEPDRDDFEPNSRTRLGRKPILHPTGGIFARIDAAAGRGEQTVDLCGWDRYADFVDYGSFCRMTAAAVTQKEVTGIIDLASGTPTRIVDAARAYILAKGYRLEIRVGAYPGSQGEPLCTFGDPAKIKKILEAEKTYSKRDLKQEGFRIAGCLK